MVTACASGISRAEGCEGLDEDGAPVPRARESVGLDKDAHPEDGCRLMALGSGDDRGLCRRWTDGLMTAALFPGPQTQLLSTRSGVSLIHRSDDGMKSIVEALRHLRRIVNRKPKRRLYWFSKKNHDATCIDFLFHVAAGCGESSQYRFTDGGDAHVE